MFDSTGSAISPTLSGRDSMKYNGLSALVMAGVVGVLLGGATLFAQEERGVTSGLKAEESTSAYSADIAAKKYGYVISRGAYAPEGKNGGEGLAALRFPGTTDKFYKLKLKYLGEYRVGGFVGSYYETEAGTNKFRILFSNNTDNHGFFHVFYADTSDQVTVDFQANRYEGGK
jgi:hypothetical protein